MEGASGLSNFRILGFSALAGWFWQIGLSYRTEKQESRKAEKQESGLFWMKTQYERRTSVDREQLDKVGTRIDPEGIKLQ